ncbi:MAG TPA: hypothetical protein VES42_17030, partial [Pilimelia sp.]|nr:hypothetical protein [Pilimelia sp.]
DLHAVLPGGRADDPRVRRAALDLADRVAALDRRPAPRGQEIDADLRLLRETLVHAEQTGFRAWSLARLRETLEAVTQIAITVGVGLLASAAAAFVAAGPVAPGLLPAAVGLAVAASCDRVRSATADLSGRRTAADRLRTGRDELAGLLDDVVTFLGHLGPTGPPDQRIREAYRQRVYDASLRALTISIGLQAAARSGTGPAADLLPALHRIDRVLREAMRTAAMPEPTTVESVVRARRQLNDLKRPAAPEPPPHRTTERPAQRSTEPPPPRRTAPTVPPGRATGASAGDLVAEIDIVTATIRSVVAADLLAAAAVLADRQNRLVAALYATASPQAEEAMALVAAARGHLATVMDDLTQATGQLEEYARMIGPR